MSPTLLEGLLRVPVGPIVMMFGAISPGKEFQMVDELQGRLLRAAHTKALVRNGQVQGPDSLGPERRRRP